MIWESTFLMSVIDVLLVLATFIVGIMFYKHYPSVRRLGFSFGMHLIFAGLMVISVFYFIDLLIMHVLPLWISYDKSMEVMTYMHLNWSWIKILIGIGAICIGSLILVHRVVPLINSALVDLKNSKQKLSDELFFRKKAEKALEEANGSLEEKIKIRTKELHSAVNTLQTEILSRQDIEIKLKKAEEQNRLIIESADDSIITIKPNGILTGWNPKAEKTFGWNFEEVYGVSIYDLLIPQGRQCVLKEMIFANSKNMKTDRSEMDWVQKSGNKLFVEFSISSFNSENGIIFSIFARDINERKMNEQRIRQLNDALEERVEQRTLELKTSLAEKEILFKEVHHRVKNNLQVILSLISLEEYSDKNIKMKKVFKEYKNRIKSIALIHETLYQSNNLLRIDMKDYILNLIQYIFHSYGVNFEEIKLRYQIDQIQLEMDDAIQCGLIINELISNSIKYAFPNGKRGEVFIGIFKTRGDKIKMIVRDDGIGLPPQFKLEEAKTLGMQIIPALIEQLGGELEISCKAGTEIKFTFSNH